MIEYHRVRSLAEALELKARYGRDLKILAGGTDVYPAKATRAGWGDRRHPALLDISGIGSLRGITAIPDGWKIGALTTWTDIVRADVPAQFDGLKSAAREVGGIQIQNRGTIAGNICNASPAADGVPPLLTMDAEVELASLGGMRRLPLSEFLTGYRQTGLAANEIVTAIRGPDLAGRGRFMKLGARRYLVISIVMAAGLVELSSDGVIVDARLAVGSCSAVAQRMPGLEAALVGQRLATLSLDGLDDGALDQLQPIDDVRATAEYRRQMAAELIRDVLAGSIATRRAA